MPNQILYTVNKGNTTKEVEYWNPYTNQYQKANPLTNIPGGSYSGFKARLEGSSPEIMATYPDSVLVDYNFTLPTSSGSTTTDGVSFATSTIETFNFDLLNNTSGDTISIAITSNGATNYVDYSSEYVGKQYIFKNNQNKKFIGTFPSSDNLTITY